MKAFWIFAEVNSWKGIDLGLIKTVLFFWHIKIWSQNKIDRQTWFKKMGTNSNQMGSFMWNVIKYKLTVMLEEAF